MNVEAVMKWAALIVFSFFCASWLTYGALHALNGVVRELDRLGAFAGGKDEDREDAQDQ